MGKLRYVTVTGADEQTDITRLLDLAATYRDSEWAILLGAQLRKRYPSWSWLVGLAEAAEDREQQINLALHLCGGVMRTWAKKSLLHVLDRPSEVVIGGLSRGGGWPGRDQTLHADAIRSLKPFRYVNRVQFNVGSGEWTPEHIRAAASNMKTWWQDVFDREVEIIVGSSPSSSLFDQLEPDNSYSVLFDGSGGRGKRPVNRAGGLPGIQCGWAGGIGAGNVAAELRDVQRVAGEADYWIDAESGLRDADDELDINQVERYLQDAHVSQLKFASVILQANYFAEGGFWNLGADGYTQDSQFGQPINLELDPSFQPGDWTADQIKDELRDTAKEVLSGSQYVERVSMLFEGSEFECLNRESV